MNYLSAGAGKLQLSMKDLRQNWQELHAVWKDPVAEKFHEEHIMVLEEATRRLLGQVSKMSEVMDKVAKKVRSDDRL